MQKSRFVDTLRAKDIASRRDRHETGNPTEAMFLAFHLHGLICFLQLISTFLVLVA